MNKTIIILSVMVLVFTFIYFIEYDLEQEKDENKDVSVENNTIIKEVTYTKLHNTDLCHMINAEKYNETHCITK